MKIRVRFHFVFVLPILFYSCKSDGDLSPDTIKIIESIEYITEDFPPYNYMEGKTINGIAVDFLLEIWKEMGANLGNNNISLLEWSEGYHKTLNEENTMLFSTSRIPERESLFQWAGPVTKINENIIALTASNLAIHSGADLKNYTIGVIEDYSNVSLLNNLGISSDELVMVPNAEMLYQKLFLREVDCIAFAETTGQIILRSLGYDPVMFTSVFTLKSSEIYYAFNINTDDKVTDAFQTTITRLKNEKGEDGSSVYEKVLNRYSLIQTSDDQITDQMVLDLAGRTASDLHSDQDATLQKINRAEAPYLDPVNASLYAFVYDTTVTMVAHATNPTLVGVSLRGKGDVTGKLFRDEIVKGALANGSGWVDYIYTKPNQGGLYQKTTCYKLAIGNRGTYFVVCAGKYK